MYIDFEGPQQQPALCGIVEYDDNADDFTFVHLLLDEDLFPAEEMGRGVIRSSLEELASRILDARRDPEGRRKVFAWSMREENALRDAGDDRLYQSAADEVVNAIPIAKEWRKIAHPEVVFEPDKKNRRNRLLRYLDLIQYEVPPNAGQGISANAISGVRSAFQKGVDFGQLDAELRGAWYSMLEHNFHDCAGMRAVLLETTGG